MRVVGGSAAIGIGIWPKMGKKFPCRLLAVSRACNGQLWHQISMWKEGPIAGRGVRVVVGVDRL